MNMNGVQPSWFVIIPIGAILACLGLGGPNSQQSVQEQEQKKIVTLSQYNQINQRMSISEVQSVVGDNGQEMESGGNMNYSYKIISWQNPDGSNMIVQFGNGYVESKAQSGL